LITKIFTDTIKTLKNKKPFFIKSVLHNKELSSFLKILLLEIVRRKGGVNQ
jgi:hypothetical protein